MHTRTALYLAGGLAAILALGVFSARDNPALAQKKPAEGEEKGREADQEAIRKSSLDFARAFEKGDAKATAALWTEHAELHDGAGRAIRGRAAIEKAFAEFLKDHPKVKME